MNVHRPSRKVPVFLARVERILNFLNKFWKNTQISNFMKICPAGAELFHANGGTDRHDEVAFRNFAKVPNKHMQY